jgi:hypothetical protein
MPAKKQASLKRLFSKPSLFNNQHHSRALDQTEKAYFTTIIKNPETEHPLTKNILLHEKVQAIKGSTIQSINC